MDCLECKNLEEVLESRLSQYIEARSAAYYRVSTELAAKKNVDMERARNDLEEHRLICVSPLRRDPSGPRATRMAFTSGAELGPYEIQIPGKPLAIVGVRSRLRSLTPDRGF
jgi:hypothetical protein